jgi:hypothetical protein
VVHDVVTDVIADVTLESRDVTLELEKRAEEKEEVERGRRICLAGDPV